MIHTTFKVCLGVLKRIRKLNKHILACQRSSMQVFSRRQCVKKLLKISCVRTRYNLHNAKTTFLCFGIMKVVLKVSIEIVFAKRIIHCQRSRKTVFLQYLVIYWFYTNFCYKKYNYEKKNQWQIAK